MEIRFFDDPLEGPKPREEVRFNQLGLFLYDDLRRVQVGFDITPFRERPSIQVTMRDPEGKQVASLHVIESLETNFSLTMHIRTPELAQWYEVTAVLYYATPETERQDVHTVTRRLDGTRPGEQ